MRRQLALIGLLTIQAIVGGCDDVTHPTTVIEYEIVSHPSISLSLVPPLGYEAEVIRQPADGWSLRDSTSDTTNPTTGLSVIGPSSSAFFVGLTSPTAESIELQVNEDIRVLTTRLAQSDALFADQGALITLDTAVGLSIDNLPTHVRILDITLPTVRAANSEAYATVFYQALIGKPFSLDDMPNDRAFSRFTVLYSLTPVLNSRGDMLTIDNSPAFQRTVLVVPSGLEVQVSALRGSLRDHFLSPYFGTESLELVDLDVQWVVEARNRSFALLLVPDAKRSVSRSEFDSFVAAGTQILDTLEELDVEPVLAVGRGCDGELSRPIVSAPGFARGADNARSLLSERSSLIVGDSDCVNGGYQGLLALDRLLATPPPEIEGTESALALLLTDGDDHSHPIDCQDCLQEIELTGLSNRLARSPWTLTSVAPSNRCIFGDFNALEGAARLSQISSASSAHMINACQSDWRPDLDNHIRALLDQASPYRFATAPLLPTLEVWLEDEPLAPDDAGGYSYRTDTASVTLGSLRPADSGAHIFGRGRALVRTGSRF